MLFLLIMVLLGTLTGYIAKRKGRSPLGWFIFGALVFIVAFPIICLNSSVNEAEPEAPLPAMTLKESSGLIYAAVGVVVMAVAAVALVG